MVDKWDIRFLRLAKEIASWSKDPSTKTGSVIVRPDRTIASMGFNGFPKGMLDEPGMYQDRDYKYSKMIHSEMNALLFSKENLYDCTLYTYPLNPCERCAVHIIQSGISRVVYSRPIIRPDWLGNTKDFFNEINIEVVEIDQEHISDRQPTQFEYPRNWKEDKTGGLGRI